ncbi:helix-turn-helix domain-containing protein [Actinocorallia longicatena]|uniref:TetR/AcrR family transcriptional regulator n=1 Tax=Actinocorallia longicatena TaxID=111803 RepID=UPI0031CF5BDF
MRADAERNRARILEAAARLFADHGAPDVTMDDIAKAAGVGRGTLYRRYPDRAAIATALLDEHERVLQSALMSGPPPLGPGAPPADRLAAFYEAMIGLLSAHAHLVLATETGHSRFTTGAYSFWRVHLATLGVTPARLDVLLAPLAPDVYTFQRSQGLTDADIVESLRTLARAVL